MKQILISTLLSALAILLLPTGAAKQNNQPIYSAQLERVVTEAAEEASITPSAAENAADDAQTQSVRLLYNGTVHLLDEQDYLCGVLMCEMPVSFEEQAFCAQSVAARTFLRRQMRGGKHENANVCADSSCCQAWADEAALRQRFGKEYDAAYKKVLRAVTATQDEVLTYDGVLIDATYFSCSGGRTEDAVAVWGTDVPYLRAVQSDGEEDAPRYHAVVTLSRDELREKLAAADAPLTLGDDPKQWLGTVSYTNGGGVESCVFGETAYSGTALRRLLGLNATRFTVSYTDGQFVFDVYGFGHRVGMSQYGAQHLAQEGWSYQQILTHYYTGAVVTRENPE